MVRNLTSHSPAGNLEPAEDPSQTITVDLRRLLESGDPELNIPLYPGDRVTVQRAGVIYVIGAVHRSGGFTLKSDHEEITVLRALALAEGLKSTAIPSRASVIRRKSAAGTERARVPLNLKKILAGRAPDYNLKADDILFVPESSGKKAMQRAAEAAVQITTGVIIWRR